MKIGRNEKCWCGSDKKYKHCHYGRESQKAVTKGDAIAHSNKIAQRKCCYVPDELKGDCSKNIINAHTISKSSSLISIADETNHVLGLKINLPNLFKNKGKLVPEKIGVNQASTFKGFCSRHDKSLFACVEDRHFTNDEEQCFALMYRSVAKELYAKEGSLVSSELLKQGDKGKQPIDQLFIQKFASDNQLGVKTAIKELSEFKSKLDSQLLGQKTNDMCHLILSSSKPIPVVVSSIVAPVSDFDGNLIQDLGDLEVVPQFLVFNSFSSDGKGYAVLSWFKGESIVQDFIGTLLTGSQEELFSKLVRFFYGVAENTFTSPSWWDSLSSTHKAKVESLIMSGVNPFKLDPKSLLVDDGVSFPGWEVESITKINF
ncbi:TPA: SEC-C metal-binding domain-containing protein [Vibrio alginolyticus]